jgi:hypothetical protein
MEGLSGRALAGRAAVLKDRLAGGIARLNDTRWSHGNRGRFVVLAGVLLVMFLRAPCFFLAPRLWAEEGACYFSNAYHWAHTSLWYKGIFYEFGGYLHLWANLATTVAANCVALENAPYVTLLFAIVAQLLPFVIVLWSESPFWRPPGRKLAGVLILLFAPLSGEVWLNTLQNQMYFTLAALLVLLERGPARAVKRWAYRLLVLTGGLTGPGTCITTPFFLLSAWKERSKERFIQGGILSLCTLVQATLLHLYPTHNRFALNPAVYILSLWSQSVGLVLVGFRQALLGPFFLALYKQGSHWFVPAALLCAVVIGLIFLFFAKGVPSRDRWLLVGMYFFLSFVCCWGGVTSDDKCDTLRTGAGARYYFVSNVIFFLLMLARCRGPMRLGRRVATAALVLSIGLGIAQYQKTAVVRPHWPQWKEEVRAWRENPAHKIAIWPPGWRLELTSLQCSPQPAAAAAQPAASAVAPGATRR